MTQVGEKLQALISLQGHGPDAVAFVLKYYDSTLTGKWRASVGLYGMPKTARGTDVAVHKSSKHPHECHQRDGIIFERYRPPHHTVL